jgi:hypothetical protein
MRICYCTGESYHILSEGFLSNYNPEYYKLGTNKDGRFEELNMPDIFIYQEKNIFATSFEHLRPEYERREKEKAEIADWIDRYKRSHDNISLFYEDENLEIFRIHQSQSKEEQFKRIWHDM